MTALIVEDTPQAIAVLEADLKTYCPEVALIDTANSVVSAAKFLWQHKPDIIFLNILLGDGTGFDNRPDRALRSRRQQQKVRTRLRRKNLRNQNPEAV